MKKISDFIFGHKIILAVCVGLLLIAGGFGLYFSFQKGYYDSDVIQFIGEGTDTREGLNFLSSNFGINGDIMLAVEGGEDDSALAEAISDISAFEGVKELIWYGTLKGTARIFEGINDILEFLGLPKTDIYNDNGLSEYLKRPIGGGRAHYVILILTEYSPSSREGFALLDRVEERLSPRGLASAGMTSTARNLLRDTMGEVPFYILFASLCILAVLLASSDSFLEPLVIFAALAVAAILNAATNIIYGVTSVISVAAAAVLQLTVTTDFALIVNGVYKKKGNHNLENGAPNAALLSAARGAFATAAAFCALFLMRFELGADIAKVTVKAVIISLISAVVVVPLMNALLGKAIEKTAFRRRLKDIPGKPADIVIRFRYAIIAFVLAAAVVSSFGLTDIKHSYFKIFESPKNPSSIEVVAGELENQLILAVPIRTKGGEGHKPFIAEVEALECVDKVIGALRAVDLDERVLENILNNTSLPKAPHFSSVFRKTEGGEWYTLYSVVIKGSADSRGAMAEYKLIQEILAKHFGDSYSFGLMTGVADINRISPADFRNLMIASAAILLAACVLALWSFKKGISVAALAVASVVINMALEAVTSNSTNFIVYQLMCVVQTGTTLNNGMLIASHFDKFKKDGLSNTDAAKGALRASLITMMASLTVLLASSVCIFFVSHNLIIKDIVKMLARGNVIGFALMSGALPAVLSLGRGKTKDCILAG